MPEWFSIEVFDGELSARAWADAHGDAVIWACQEHGATEWSWHHHSWGLLLEVELPSELAWERFRGAPAVRAALDAVPNPMFGLILHRGRGGSAGARQPRDVRPLVGAGAAALPIPEEPDEYVGAPAAVLLV